MLCSTLRRPHMLCTYVLAVLAILAVQASKQTSERQKEHQNGLYCSWLTSSVFCFDIFLL
jgi:hypothetical protein